MSSDAQLFQVERILNHRLNTKVSYLSVHNVTLYYKLSRHLVPCCNCWMLCYKHSSTGLAQHRCVCICRVCMVSHVLCVYSAWSHCVCMFTLVTVCVCAYVCMYVCMPV